MLGRKKPTVQNWWVFPHRGKRPNYWCSKLCKFPFQSEFIFFWESCLENLRWRGLFQDSEPKYRLHINVWPCFNNSNVVWCYWSFPFHTAAKIITHPQGSFSSCLYGAPLTCFNIVLVINFGPMNNWFSYQAQMCLLVLKTIRYERLVHQELRGQRDQ